MYFTYFHVYLCYIFMGVSVHPHLLCRYFPDLCFELLLLLFHGSARFTGLHTWIHFQNGSHAHFTCKCYAPIGRLLRGGVCDEPCAWECLSAFSNWVTAAWTLAYGRSVAVLSKFCEFFGNCTVALEHLHHIECCDKPVVAREYFLWNFASATVNFSKHHHFFPTTIGLNSALW